MSIIVYEVKKNEDVELRTKKKFPYDHIISILMAGNTVFLEVNRRQAYYIRKTIEKKINELVSATPCYYKGMEGYVFSFEPARIVRISYYEKDDERDLRGNQEKKGESGG